MNTNSEKANWILEIGINEELHSTAQAISSAYSLLKYHNPEHPDNEKWDKLAVEWFFYNKNIETSLFSTTREDAEVELKRIREAYHVVRQLENEIEAKKK